MKWIDKKSALIILGLVVSILAMETIPQDLFGIVKTELVNPADEEGKEESTVNKQSDFALPLSLQFEISPVLQLLNILPENEEESTSQTIFEEFINAQQKVLKVLFQQIISPNAP